MINRLLHYAKKRVLMIWKVKLISIAILLMLFAFDLITKYAAKTYLEMQTPDVLKISSTLFFSYNENAGLSFGLLDGSRDWAITIQVFITIIVFLGLAFCSKVEYSFTFLWIAAGGISNVVDRFDDGNVVDFISFDNKIYFNLGDTFVIIGVIFALYSLFLTESDDENTQIREIGFSKKKTKTR